MSSFAVTLRKISKVWKHPNADKLDLAQVDGCSYQFVVGRDNYKVGDQVLYFPIDSVFNQVQHLRMLGLEGKLSGKEKNRLKTVKLRGEISQGLVCRPGDLMSGITNEMAIENMSKMTPLDITAALSITKYEPPMISSKAGNLIHMPGDIPIYDIEGADSHPEIVEMLMNQKVYITEKVEGTNFWISVSYSDEADAAPWDDLPVSFGTRHHEVKPIENIEHDFIKVAKDQKLDGFVRWLAMDHYFGKKVTARGEYCGPGVQSNIYGFKENKIFLFDIFVDGKYLPPQEFVDHCNSWGALTAPLLVKDVFLKDWLTGKTIREMSNGESKITLKPGLLREGIVIKPMVEQDVPSFGRLFIKQRSPEYLAGSDL